MNKNLVLFFLLFTSCIVAQTKDVKLSGRITTVDNDPLEEITVYLTKHSDSTVVNYSITDVTGKFDLTTKPINQEVVFAVSAPGFRTFKKSFEFLSESYSFGQIQLEEIGEVLDEIVIESEAAPIRIKNDTIEFNANSFKVRPDATVKQLLEQLPGVTVAADGTISVNGKKVNNILVNGKPFFGEDGKIALENLPADIINKVQVSDFKTKEQKFTGEKGSDTETSINLTIDEDKNKGQFGRITAGYGTDDRYESSLLYNMFRGKRKFSVLASSNNVNSSGFSMDEVFDNMSGGRNDWERKYSFVDGFNFYDGITINNLVGLNYNDASSNDKFSASLSYVLKDADNVTESESYTQNLLPERKIFSNVKDGSKQFSNGHSISGQFEYEPNKDHKLEWAPSFDVNNQKIFNNYNQDSFNEDNSLTNTSEGKTFSESDVKKFGNFLSYYKRFTNKSTLSLEFENENEVTDRVQEVYRNTIFINDTSLNDYRNQTYNERLTTDDYNLRFAYRKLINTKKSLYFNLEYNFVQNKESQDVFDKNNTSSVATVDYLTWENIFSKSTISPMIRFHHTNQTGPSYSIHLGNSMNYYTIDTYHLNSRNILKRQSILPNVTFRYSNKFGKDWRYSLSYNIEGRIPEMRQMLSYANRNSTTSVQLGNPELDDVIGQSVNINLNKYDFETRSGLFLYGNVRHVFNDVVNTSTVDDNFFTTYKYENVKDIYSYNFSLTYSKEYTINDHKIKPEASLSLYSSYNKGMINNQAYEANVDYITPHIQASWKYKEIFDLTPSYSVSTNNAKYYNYSITGSKSIMHEAKLSLTTFVPKNVVFGSDLTYNNNPNLGTGLNNDFLLWNASLGYTFLNQQLTVKVKGYDLLNQNQSISRYNSATSIVDSKSLVLQRYVMFSLTYKLNKFGGKQESGTNHVIVM